MFESLTNTPQKIVIVNDANIKEEVMVDAIKKSKINCGEIKTIFFGPQSKEEFPDLQLNIEKNGPEDIKEVPDELYEAIKDADILFVHFCPVSKKTIELGKNLKLILTNRGGLEHINVPEASKHNIPVVNTVRNAEAVCESTLAMIIDISRNITLSHSLLQQGKWCRTYFNSEYQKTLVNCKVGLIGLGVIGKLFAKKLLALGIPVIGYDEFITKEDLLKEDLADIEFTNDLDYLLKESDFVSLHLRFVPTTKGWFKKEYYTKMKKTAYFINCARGGLMNYDDLVWALDNKYIAGAALDVFDYEPLPDGYPLLHRDNVLCVSHLAGTTQDSLALSPYIVCKDLDVIIDKGITTRIVNFKNINIK